MRKPVRGETKIEEIETHGTDLHPLSLGGEGIKPAPEAKTLINEGEEGGSSSMR